MFNRALVLSLILTATNFTPSFATETDFAYIDKSGKVVISGPFGVARDFEGGVAIVDVKIFDLIEGKWTVSADPSKRNSRPLDSDGNIIDKYDFAPEHGFLDELIAVPAKKKEHEVIFAMVDKKWNEVSRIKATKIGAYSNGLIASLDPNSSLWGYIDSTGKQVLKPTFVEARRFSEGLAAVRFEKGIASKPSLIGFIDKTGKLVIPANYNQVSDFHNGFAAVSKNQKWGFIDEKGATIIPFEYDWLDNFSKTQDGLLAAAAKDHKVGFINIQNKTILPFEYVDARSFSEDLAPVTNDGQKWGYINSKGKTIIEHKFLKASIFDSGRALVFVPARLDYGKRKEDSQFMFLTGKSALAEKDLDKAVAAFNTAIKLAPGTPPAKKSRYYLESATPIKPVANDIVNMLKQVEMSEAIGNHKDAQVILDKCFAQAPHSEWVAIRVSHSKINQGKTDEARKILDKMVEVNNKYAPTYVHLARVAFANGDEREAKRLIEKAHELNPYSELVNQYYPFSSAKMKQTATP